MGAIYVVEQISTGKQRALKLMLPQLVADAALRRRFEQEARVGALIESEHVVDVVEPGTVNPAALKRRDPLIVGHVSHAAGPTR